MRVVVVIMMPLFKASSVSSTLQENLTSAHYKNRTNCAVFLARKQTNAEGLSHVLPGELWRLGLVGSRSQHQLVTLSAGRAESCRQLAQSITGAGAVRRRRRRTPAPPLNKWPAFSQLAALTALSTGPLPVAFRPIMWNGHQHQFR